MWLRAACPQFSPAVGAVTPIPCRGLRLGPAPGVCRASRGSSERGLTQTALALGAASVPAGTEWLPPPVSGLENSVDHSPWGRKDDTLTRLERLCLFCACTALGGKVWGTQERDGAARTSLCGLRVMPHTQQCFSDVIT